jgi:hypothetical protein
MQKRPHLQKVWPFKLQIEANSCAFAPFAPAHDANVFPKGNETSKFRVMSAMGKIQTKMLLAATFALPALFCAPGAAWSQANYNVQTMNFDMWCQEQQHLNPDRCDKRTPEDEKDFESYRTRIEQYEIPYLQQKQNAIALDRNILNKDPVDNPITQDSQTQSLQQQRSQTVDPRTPEP